MVFALSMALFLFGLFCAVVDVAYLMDWSANVQAAAQIAAQSGANSVDPQFLYGNGTGPIVDTGSYANACRQSGYTSASIKPPYGEAYPANGYVKCNTDGCSVGATVIKSVKLPLMIPGFPSVRLVASFVAAPVIGANTPEQHQQACGPLQPPAP